MSYLPNAKWYDGAVLKRRGRSGIVLPPISLALWQNFGDVNVFETGRTVMRRVFDRGGGRECRLNLAPRRLANNKRCYRGQIQIAIFGEIGGEY
jgi:hypothetical protein